MRGFTLQRLVWTFESALSFSFSFSSMGFFLFWLAPLLALALPSLGHLLDSLVFAGVWVLHLFMALVGFGVRTCWGLWEIAFGKGLTGMDFAISFG